jgi:transposase-like protein
MKELLEEYREEHGKLPECNGPFESKKEVLSEVEFHFYIGIDDPLHQMAINIQDFKEKISQVPIASLEFHQTRGDFAKWIKEGLKDSQLAEIIQKIDRIGEALRIALLVALGNSNQAQCPTCQVETIPVKTWKMAGRPDKAGERLQLTIGYYKCHNCNKTFRHVLAKEKIKANIIA